MIKSRKSPSFWPQRIVDAACCWLLASGLITLMEWQFMSRYSMPVILTSTLIAAGILAVTTIRWFLLPAILGGGALLTVSIAAAAGKLGDFIPFAAGFIQWLLDGMPQDSVYFTDSNFTLVQILLCAGVSGVVFLWIRRLRSVTLLIAGALALILISILQGTQEESLLPLLLIGAGAFPVIASNFYSKRKSLRAIFRRKKALMVTPHWVVQITALAVCAVSVVLSVFILPQDTSALRFRVAADWTADIQSATGLYSNQQKQSKASNLHELGLQPRMRLGGDLEFETDDILAVVYADDKVFLKDTVLDVYDGTMWTSSFDAAYRVGNGLFQETQQQVLNDYTTNDDPSMDRTRLELHSALASQFYDGICTKKQATIMLTEETSHLLVPSGLMNLHEQSPTIDPVMFNYLSEVFVYGTLPEFYTYDVQYQDMRLNEARIANLAPFTKLVADPLLEDEAFVKKYTALPQGFPQSVAQLARNLTENVESDYQKAVELVKYLSDESIFTYTNTPGPLPQGTDISAHLLDSKKGTSVYYATCLATMARSLGIPSRLVGGYYAQNWDDTYKAFVAKESDAMAWTECYFKSVGWVALYPFPLPSTSNISTEETTAAPPLDLFSGDESPRPQVIPADRVFSLITLWILCIFLILCLLFLLVRSLFSGRLYRLPYVKKHFKTNESRIFYYEYGMSKQLRVLGIKQRPSDTIMEYAAKTRALACHSWIEESFQLLSDVRYGLHREIPGQTVEQMAKTYMELEKQVKAKTNWFRYFLLRRMLLPGRLCYRLEKECGKIARAARAFKKKQAERLFPSRRISRI